MRSIPASRLKVGESPIWTLFLPIIGIGKSVHRFSIMMSQHTARTRLVPDLHA